MSGTSSVRARAYRSVHPRDLPLHVALGLAEVGQTGGGGVHRVELDQRVDQRLGEGAHPGGVELHSSGSRVPRRMRPGTRSIT